MIFILNCCEVVYACFILIFGQLTLTDILCKCTTAKEAALSIF